MSFKLYDLNPKRQPKTSAPKIIQTVDNEKFQVVGEDKLYDSPMDAMARAKKRGAGSTVIRMSDGKTISTVPGNVPMAPSEL